MSGLFAAAFLRQIGWDADVYERSSVELVGRGAGITTHPELLQALERAAPAPAISASRSSEAHRARPPGPRHRREAAAADPDLLGPAAATAARDHRPRALPSRLEFRARRAERPRRARAFLRRPGRTCRHPRRRRRHPLRRARRRSRPRCSRSMPATTSGAARPTKPTCRRETLAEIFPTSCSSAAAAAGHRLSDRGLQQRPAARPPPLQFHLVSGGRRRDSCGRCASTRTAPARISRCRRR